MKSILDQVRLIIRLARPHFLIPGFMLYLFGYLVAILFGAANDLEKFATGYMIFASAHLSVSFSNDYFDWEADKNSKRTAFSGGSKVLVEHPELKKFALVMSIVLLSLSFSGAAIFTLAYAYPISFFLLVLLGGMTGFFYTAPPLKFAYRGVGELATVFAVGVLMPGMGYFVANGAIDSAFGVFVPAISCFGLFFILTVELPDVESDKNSKSNILTRQGEKSAMKVSVIATTIGTSLLALIYFSGILHGKINLAPILLFSLIPFIVSIRGLRVDVACRKELIRQVKFNMTSMHLLLLFMNFSLLAQIFL